MSDSIYEQIGRDAFYLKLDLSAEHIAKLSMNESWSDEHLQAVADIFTYMRGKRQIARVLTRKATVVPVAF